MNIFVSEGKLHHAYCITGDTKNIFRDLEKFFEKELDFSIYGNPDFWYGEYDVMDVEDSRSLKELHLNKPIQGDKKIFVVSTNFITEKAQNAILKLFEEPSGDTHFFLIMPSTVNIIPTLRSRMIFIESENKKTSVIHVKDFLKMSPKDRFEEIKKLMESIADEEKSKIEVTGFLNELEREFRKDTNFTKDNQKIGLFEQIETIRQYASEQSPSLKMLLEYLALTLPIRK